MKRSLQEVVELVVFGLVALLVGTALVWVLGWVLSLGGALFKALAGLLWLLLRFIVPIAIVAGIVYFLVKALQGRDGAALAGAGGPDTSELSRSASREAVDNVQRVVDEMQAERSGAATGSSAEPGMGAAEPDMADGAAPQATTPSDMDASGFDDMPADAMESDVVEGDLPADGLTGDGTPDEDAPKS
ncbi:MAG: hypothetical protein GX560_11065 [Deinococcales bacterium]|nr:hypothetical protein [Deinococcales bacterium]